MKLKPYLDAMPIAERRAFARRVGVTPEYLSIAARHHRQPGHRLCTLIVEATNGAVTMAELRPDWYGGTAHQPAGQAVGTSA